MIAEEELLYARFQNLAASVYEKGHYMFTDFLGLMELDVFLRAAPAFSYLPYTLFGGAEGCERVMVRLGDEETLGYAPPAFPIACLLVKASAPKFAEPLSHRDYLGALLNLGLRRECTGDIAISEEGAFLFCEERLAPFIIENLTRVRHTAVQVDICTPPADIRQRTEGQRIQVQSPRADATVARAYNLSRADGAALFPAGRIFINGRCIKDGSVNLKDGDMLTARGYGRLRYLGISGTTRKGKLNAEIEKFI